jgi:hypothetical protein
VKGRQWARGSSDPENLVVWASCSVSCNPADEAVRTVVGWSDWEFGYGTDGGLGGLVTRSVLDRAEEDDWNYENSPINFELEDRFGEGTSLWDLDGEPGDDLLIFENGFGDGAFPMARGLDADRNTVSLVLWDNRYPWRLAIPDGTPPPTVTDREREFQECRDGERTIGPDGSCPSDL